MQSILSLPNSDLPSGRFRRVLLGYLQAENTIPELRISLVAFRIRRQSERPLERPAHERQVCGTDRKIR